MSERYYSLAEVIQMVDAALGAAQLRVEIQLRRNGVGESEIKMALAAIDALRGESE